MIPGTAHFVWFGRRFPFLYGMALKSAAMNGGFDNVVLHHTDPIDGTAGWRVAATLPGVERRCLAPEALLHSIPDLGGALRELFNRLDAPAARANMIRAALLYREGGVYLDTDVLTIRSFRPLRDTALFCGEERIALPGALSHSRNPFDYLAAGARLVARDICRRLPNGWRAFRRIEPRYPPVVNNAVLGAEASNDTLFGLLETMIRLPRSRQIKRFALGTHLLERAVALTPDRFTVYPPSRFYPIGPEVSEHWFKRAAHVDTTSFVQPDTVAIHWYASVRTRRYIDRFDAEWVRENMETRPICALLAPMLG